MTTMLYKHPGPHNIHGDKFDWIIADGDEQIAECIKAGWSLTTDEARGKKKRGRKPKK